MAGGRDMNMVVVESLCLFIVAMSLGLRIVFKGGFWSQIELYVSIAAVAWLTENTCIHFYGFYSYSPSWHLFIDQVPIMIPLIWPIVILSARDLVVPVTREHPIWTAISVGLLVFTDAAFIEPISVYLGFWQWYEPGFFEVPVIGVVGWGLFAMFALLVLGPLQNPRRRCLLLFSILAPIFTHLALLALWWACFRRVTGPIADQATVLISLVVLALLSALVIHAKSSRRIGSRDVWLRFPAALFFFGLLAWDFNNVKLELLVFAMGFSMPYLSLCTVVFFVGDRSGNKKSEGNESLSVMPLESKE